MKKVIVLILLLASMMSLIGCQPASDEPTTDPAVESSQMPSEEASESAPEKKLNFVLSTHDPTIPWVQPMKNACDDIAAEFGVNVQFTGPSPADAVQQLEQLKTLYEQGMMDALAVMPLENETLRPFIDELMENGIPVVCVSQDIEDSKRLAFYGQSFGSLETTAYDLSKKTIEMLGPNPTGKVAILVSLPDLEALIKREEGSTRAINEYPGLELIGTFSNNTDFAAAYAEIEAILTANPDIVALFAQDAVNTPSAAKVVRDLGLSDKVKVCGYDMTEEALLLVKEGCLHYLVGQNPYETAYLALKGLYDYMVNDVQPVTVEVEADYATQSNIDDFLRSYNVAS